MNNTEKNALEQRIDELCAEVERLHAEQVYWELGNCPSCPNIADLQEALEQNAKLRKELSDVYTLHWNGLDCTECPWFDECGTMGGCPWLGILADHMRSLGIEVTE